MSGITKRAICWSGAALVLALYLMLMGLEWSGAITHAPFGLAGLGMIATLILWHAGYEAGRPRPAMVYVERPPRLEASPTLPVRAMASVPAAKGEPAPSALPEDKYMHDVAEAFRLGQRNPPPESV